MALFTQAEKWYLVSPEATGDWASVVTGWNASNVTFYNLIYKLKAGISHNQALTTNDWESVDITDTVNNTSYSSNLGYWVYVESITSDPGGGNGGGTVTENDWGNVVVGDAASHTITLYPLDGTAPQTGDKIGYFVERNGTMELRGKGTVAYNAGASAYFVAGVVINRFGGEVALSKVSYLRMTTPGGTEGTIIDVGLGSFPALADNGNTTMALTVNTA